MDQLRRDLARWREQWQRYRRDRDDYDQARRDAPEERVWLAHHGSSIGVVRAPERKNEIINRAIFQRHIDENSGWKEGDADGEH